MSNACKACGAPLLWAISKNGKRSPLTAAPKDNGNCLVFRKGEQVHYVALAPTIAGLLRKEGVPLRLNHFADCEQANEFRGAGA